MKRIFLTITLLLLTSSLFLLPTFAMAENETEEIEQNEASLSQEADTPPTTSGLLLDFIEDKGDDICQYLSLVFSVVLAWLFKKGVLPSLSGSMGKLSNTLDGGISALLEQGKALSKNTEDKMHTFIETVTPTLEIIGQVAENEKRTDQLLLLLEKELEVSMADRKDIKAVLSAQMDLFYQFFMAVNLPQYQKDQLGESYTRLKALTEASHDEHL